MDNCTLPDFLPGSTNGDGRRRYALQEMMCMRAACLGKPSGMQDYARDGSLLQCSLLADRSNPFSWEQLAGSLQVRVLQGMLYLQALRRGQVDGDLHINIKAITCRLCMIRYRDSQHS